MMKAAPPNKRRRKNAGVASAKSGRAAGASRTTSSATVSLRFYAKHRAVSVEAVRKAIKAQRLAKSIVIVRGVPQIANVALADKEWAANTDLSRAHDDVKLKAAQQLPPISKELLDQSRAPGRETERGRVLGFGEQQPHGGWLKRQTLEPDTSIAAASAQEKHWRAKKAELDYKKAAGELVDAKALQAGLVERITTCRSKLLGLPTKAKSQLPHLTLEDVAALEAIVREALEELAS